MTTAMVDRKFGCFYPSTTLSGGAYAYNFDYLESVVGRKFDVFSTFLDMSVDYPGNATPPATRKQHSELAAAAAAGHDLLVAFGTVTQYVQATDGNYYGVYATGAEIQAGTWDARLTAVFNWLLGIGVTVNLRWCWEANLGPNVSAYYPGASAQSGTGTPAPPSGGAVLTTTGLSVYTSPADFIATWVYVTTLLRGLTNASRLKMFYCPGANDSTAALAAGNTLSTMFPGTTYADIVGYDSYNVIGSTWQSALDTLRGIRVSDSTDRYAYDLLTALHPSADVWVGEVGCVDQNDAKDTSHAAVGHSKAQWFIDAFSLLGTDLPALKCVNFFDAVGSRNTWPFGSSSAALVGFQQGFNFGPAGSTTQHGTVAPAYTPTAGVPPVNPTGIGLPFGGNHQVGDSGRTAIINGHEYAINQAMKGDPSGWVALAGNADGTIPVVAVTRQAVGTGSVPDIAVKHPGGGGSNVLTTKVGSNTHTSLEIRDDGRIALGPGDTGDPDLLLLRSGTGTFTVTGVGVNPGNLVVTGSAQADHLSLADAATPSAPTAGGGVQVYASNDALKVRGVGGVAVLIPSPLDRYAGWMLNGPPGAAASTSAAVNGRVYLVRKQVPQAVTLSRFSYNVSTIAATPAAAQNWVGVATAAGVLLGLGPDQSTPSTVLGTKNTTVLTVVSGQSLAVAGLAFVYEVLLFNATTPPVLSAFNALDTTFLPNTGTSQNYATLGPYTVTGVSVASPGVVTTSVAHGLTTGDKVNITGVVGTTEANGAGLSVTVLSATTFSVGVNTTNAYVSGGSVGHATIPVSLNTSGASADTTCKLTGLK